MALTYATPGTLTWTPASLANNTYDGSAAVDNGSTVYLDVFVGGKLTTGTSPTAGSLLKLFAFGSWDGGTTYSAGISGSDGGTPGTGESDQLFFLDAIEVDATSDHTYEFGPLSLVEAFGGLVIPEHWGLVVLNETGVALNATAGNHEVKYTGVTL